MNITKFGRLVTGEKFRLPGSKMSMVKETLREEPGFGWVNASFDDPNQGQPCYFPDDTQVMRRRSNDDKELKLKGQPLQYQCIRCQKWVEENGAAMAKEGVMCLDCYSLSLKTKKGWDKDLNSPTILARL